ncbi:glycosyltransferase [Pseudanabaena mucicola]|uniref:Glycosyltransferase n=1 Tax=Pseudanabaena mucicola FACHB-723 TaxID=2692860 RepID=A0ABR7ZYR4_9CYAN|nr:glycosyltransferase [Pseudanabaena mucicola]MBD2189098.1 glycosyltransferase [Pseudanabaena mucicola FACHB-723]
MITSPRRLLFLVNGSESSAAGIRAQLFADRFDDQWKIHFCYRPTRKWQGIFSFIQNALNFRPHIIYVIDVAYTGVLSGFASKKILGCRLVIDSGDVAYELAKSSGNYSKGQLALINGVENLALHNADRFVVRGSFHQEFLSHQGFKHVEFIPDGVEVNRAKIVDPREFKQSLGLKDFLIVGLVGSMEWSERHQMCYGWDIVEAMVMLKDEPIAALLIGDGNGKVILEERARKLGVSDRIKFVGRISYENLSTYICAIDVCISTQSNDIVGMVRTTGKLPLYLAHGRYVIATDVGEAKKVLPNLGCLLPYQGVRDPEHPRRLAKHLQLLLQEPQRLEVADKARQVATDNFDYDLLGKRVVSMCEQLIL